MIRTAVFHLQFIIEYFKIMTILIKSMHYLCLILFSINAQIHTIYVHFIDTDWWTDGETRLLL